MILRGILKVTHDSVVWIQLPGVKWWSLLNRVMSVRFIKGKGFDHLNYYKLLLSMDLRSICPTNLNEEQKLSSVSLCKFISPLVHPHITFISLYSQVYK
jgi:hypothetical protein